MLTPCLNFGMASMPFLMNGSLPFAERVLMEAELDWRKRRKVVDKLAATIILQGYLDSNPRL